MLLFAAQGHVMPFMELSYRLVEHGFEVVFVNTDFNHARMLTALAGTSPAGGIDLISFPDGMGPDGDRTDIGKVLDGLPAAMIRSRNIRWVVADLSMSFVLEAGASPQGGRACRLVLHFLRRHLRAGDAPSQDDRGWHHRRNG